MSYITERRQEEKDRRRGEIVDAAEALYQELGWDAVTMDSVARRARLSRALVYVYFKDKRDLHFAIAGRAMQTLLERFQDASDRHKAGLEKVVAIGRAYMAYGQEFPHYFDACARM
ncbi:MAG TPA: helix-turn-helix domain-containing protein, partial [Povalibacter sp.]|nr:helix-turn-helix domain-containing protein [Povalibacter sp.]